MTELHADDRLMLAEIEDEGLRSEVEKDCLAIPHNTRGAVLRSTLDLQIQCMVNAVTAPNLTSVSYGSLCVGTLLGVTGVRNTGTTSDTLKLFVEGLFTFLLQHPELETEYQELMQTLNRELAKRLNETG